MMEFLNSLMPNLMENFPEFLKAIQETIDFVMLSLHRLGLRVRVIFYS